jgi:GNAT superfamily N-acetyltransferase
MTNSDNSTNIIARRAKPKDVLAISTLCRMAVDELNPERGGALLVGLPDSGCMGLDPELTALSSGKLENDNYELNYHWFVGVSNDTPVGVAFIRVVKIHNFNIAHVELLYVEKNSRGHGIGSAILQLITKWATRKSCIGIDIPALPGKRETKVFLEANGYKARSILMFKDIDTV